MSGKAVANAPSPDTESIPWLLVNIVGHSGSDGVLTRATTIQRLNTKAAKHLPLDATRDTGPGSPRRVFRRLSLLRAQVTAEREQR